VYWIEVTIITLASKKRGGKSLFRDHSGVMSQTCPAKNR
jgi:hypothetical protein